MNLAKVLAVSGLSFMSMAGINQASADSNIDKGAEVFESVCTMCHGEQAQGGEDFEAPKLAGQHDWYLELQLNNFRQPTPHGNK